MIEMEHRNWRRYNHRSTVGFYASQKRLFAAEARILERIAHEIRDRPILDLGVGTGRTTPDLLAISRQYLGLDYSPRMIHMCRATYPGVPFAVGDARELGYLADSTYGLILFSFNGIDYVTHPERLRVLREVRRLLADDGFFVFSTHNARCLPQKPYDIRRLQLTWNPAKLAWRVLGYVAGIGHYFRIRKLLFEGEEYSYRASGGQNYTVVSYHISVESQIEQLRENGFVVAGILNSMGVEIDARSDDASPWLYFLVRKS
ncbi:MAG: class I SAM-dependent methyltransferase [Gammaproteobacteria bacterium]